MINFFKNIFQECHQSVKQFESRSGPTYFPSQLSSTCISHAVLTAHVRTSKAFSLSLKMRSRSPSLASSSLNLTVATYSDFTADLSDHGPVIALQACLSLGQWPSFTGMLKRFKLWQYLLQSVRNQSRPGKRSGLIWVQSV